jgi:hypothetical protein
MYFRTTQRKNTNGSVVRYVQFAHKHRVEGVTRADVLVNLGREDRLNRDGLGRLVASINRHLGEPEAADSGDGRVEVGDALTAVDSRPMGVAWLLDGLWSQLGVDTALRAVLGRRKFPPMSNGCCSRWWRTGRSTRPPSWLRRSGHRSEPGS